MDIDRERGEELKIAEILIHSAIAIGLLSIQFWVWLGKSTITGLAVFVNLLVMGALVLIGLYLALFGEKKRKKYLALVGK